MAYNGQPQFLAFHIFAVVIPGQGRQCFGQADKTHAQGTVAQHFFHRVGSRELVGVHPHALFHQEREVIYFFFALNAQPVTQLADGQIHAVV